MAVFKIKYAKTGDQHIECRLFVAEQPNLTWAGCGKVIVRADELEPMQKAMSGVSFEHAGNQEEQR